LYVGFEDIEKLEEVQLVTKAQKRDGRYLVKLKNPSEGLAFMIRVKLAEPETDKPIRPSFYTDNFFSLLPGEEKSVEIETYEPVPSASLVVEGWNVKKAVHKF
jgi:exo-1,4-beta-D-glucosaminidase